MNNVNDGSNALPRLALYVNEWALNELPRRPSAETWTFEHCIERAAAARYDGAQAGVQYAEIVRAAGLRFCTSARINTPEDALPAIVQAAEVQADCVTVHAGWGMETDAQIDALADAILAASEKCNLPVYVETHRATMIQDPFRTTELLKRRPTLALNGDFSHFYCGQEMTYRGFANTRDDLHAMYDRVCFIHGRVSDAECMQCDITDPAKAQHVRNFVDLWTRSMRGWRSRAKAGDVFIFTPELGPPSSGYSITVRDLSGKSFEVCDRWQQSLLLCDLAREAFANSAGASERASME